MIFQRKISYYHLKSQGILKKIITHYLKKPGRARAAMFANA